MMERKLTFAEIILIAGTRVALGAGLGLLLSSKLNNDQRKAAGLVAVSAVAAMPVLTTTVSHVFSRIATIVGSAVS